MTNILTEQQTQRARFLFIGLFSGLLLTITSWILLHGGLWWANGRWLDPFTTTSNQWLDWILVSLIGVLLYLLTTASRWYRTLLTAQETNLQEQKEEERAMFVEMTPWYITTLIKGPFIVLVIIIFLTNVSLDISGLTVDFTQLSPEALLVVAFVLGFYSRVAREQLNMIVKTLFSKAYSKAEEAFTIIPHVKDIASGQTVQFKTSYPLEVTWLASAGQIENGVYTAPDGMKAGQEVQITAVPKDANIPRATAKVTLHQPSATPELSVDG